MVLDFWGAYNWACGPVDAVGGAVRWCLQAGGWSKGCGYNTDVGKRIFEEFEWHRLIWWYVIVMGLMEIVMDAGVGPVVEGRMGVAKVGL